MGSRSACAQGPSVDLGDRGLAFEALSDLPGHGQLKVAHQLLPGLDHSVLGEAELHGVIEDRHPSGHKDADLRGLHGNQRASHSGTPGSHLTIVGLAGIEGDGAVLHQGDLGAVGWAP